MVGGPLSDVRIMLCAIVGVKMRRKRQENKNRLGSQRWVGACESVKIWRYFVRISCMHGRACKLGLGDAVTCPVPLTYRGPGPDGIITHLSHSNPIVLLRWT